MSGIIFIVLILFLWGAPQVIDAQVTERQLLKTDLSNCPPATVNCVVSITNLGGVRLNGVPIPATFGSNEFSFPEPSIRESKLVVNMTYPRGSLVNESPAVYCDSTIESSLWNDRYMIFDYTYSSSASQLLDGMIQQTATVTVSQFCGDASNPGTNGGGGGSLPGAGNTNGGGGGVDNSSFTSIIFGIGFGVLFCCSPLMCCYYRLKVHRLRRELKELKGNPVAEDKETNRPKRSSISMVLHQLQRDLIDSKNEMLKMRQEAIDRANNRRSLDPPRRNRRSITDRLFHRDSGRDNPQFEGGQHDDDDANDPPL